MALGYKPSYVDFSWISQLPDLAKAAEEDRKIKEAFGSGIDWNNPEQVEKIASIVGGIGGERGIKLSMGLADLAHKRRESAAQSARDAAAANVLGGGGGPVTMGPAQTTRYTPDVVAAADAAGLPEGARNLMLRIQPQESGNLPPGVMSPKGAQGVMQLTGPTAQAYGVTNRADPRQSTKGGAAFIKDLWEKYGGNEGLVAAGYIAGETELNKYLAGQPSRVGPDTRAYVRKTTGRTLEDWVGAAADPVKRGVFGAEDLGAKYDAASRQMSPQERAVGAMLGAGKVSPSTATGLANMQKMEQERRLEQVKSDEKDFKEYQGEVYKKRGEASNLTGLIDRAEKLVNDPKTFQGTGSDVFARIGSFVGVVDNIAKQMGVNLPVDMLKQPVANVEELRGLSNQIVLGILGGKLGAQVSNTDREFVKEAQVSIGNSAEANRMLINIARKAALRDKQVAAMTSAYYNKGGKSRAQLEAYISEWAEANPIVTAADRAILERDRAAKMQGGAQPPPQGGAQLPAGAPSVLYKGGKPVKVIGVGPDGTLITEDQAPRVPAGGI